jgi:hypothetical protein
MLLTILFETGLKKKQFPKKWVYFVQWRNIICIQTSIFDLALAKTNFWAWPNIKTMIKLLSKCESELGVCNSLQRQPSYFYFSCQSREYFPYPMNLGWSYSLLPPLGCTNNGSISILYPGFKRSCNFHSQVLRTQCLPWQQVQDSLWKGEDPCG